MLALRRALLWLAAALALGATVLRSAPGSGGAVRVAAAEAQPEREEGAGAPNWDVLKDDYGMEHTKLKHWDDDGDESSSEEHPEVG